MSATVRSSSRSAFLIWHPDRGIFLGHCMGLGFWSKLDPVGQPSAVTFPSREIAEQYMAGWDHGRPTEASLHPVIPDDGDYASIAACVAAGLEGWIDEYTPVANGFAA